MDSLHEAHLTRILEARRRRGVLGAFCELVATPPLRKYADGAMSPPSPAPPRQRRGSSTGTQTTGCSKMAAAAQTMPTPAAPTSASPLLQSSPGASPTPSDWRQSVPRSRAAGAAAPPLMSPNPKATLGGGVRFQSPGRVPSLAYSTPNSISRRRADLRRSLASASSPGWFSGAGGRACSIEPLSPPLYIPRPHSALREPLWPERLSSRERWGRWTSCSHWHPLVMSPTCMNTRRDRSCISTCPSPMTWSQRGTSHLSRWNDGPATTPNMESPGQKRGASHGNRHRSSRHQSRHHRRHSSQSCDDGRDGREGSGVKSPLHWHGRPGVRKSTSRDDSSQPRGGSWRRAGAERDEDGAVGRKQLSGRRRRYDARQLRDICAPPVVPMGPFPGAAPPSSSREGSSRWSHSSSAALLPHRSPRPSRPPVQLEREPALGLPDAHSTMDLLTSVETLRAGDWFYKWTVKGDSVHPRWVWIDVKRYLLVWSNYETHNPRFCGNVRLDRICQVTLRDLSTLDERGLPKTYYVLLIETRKRVLQLATELKEKCDMWFEALNNVVNFIRRNDMIKGARIPD
ncbi:hypothetical protein LSCM1_03582 [Leishmania martiniquensis]|uniref:Pleckstrin homology domain-containing protein n=1 Tax=Leishmania martiniquensis TaxID=1580590 RepID=A0A836KJR4_9TRYP|nr:hypothetical protein LSCM1_03582 [Leishmania martiniquensis]